MLKLVHWRILIQYPTSKSWRIYCILNTLKVYNNKESVTSYNNIKKGMDFNRLRTFIFQLFYSVRPSSASSPTTIDWNRIGQMANEIRSKLSLSNTYGNWKQKYESRRFQNKVPVNMTFPYIFFCTQTIWLRSLFFNITKRKLFFWSQNCNFLLGPADK